MKLSSMVLAAFVSCMGAAETLSARQAARPNVIVIVSDDMGYADVGFQGCKDIPTPHIDSLAQHGIRNALLTSIAPTGTMVAIRSYCLDCCAGQPGEVRKCVATSCQLWPFQRWIMPPLPTAQTSDAVTAQMAFRFWAVGLDCTPRPMTVAG